MIKIGYHGTNTKIDAFDLSHLGKNQGQTIFPGIYFSTNYQDAFNFAKLAVEKSGGSSVVYIAECELNKPLEQNRNIKIFNTLGEMISFIKEYFPDWFDKDGEIKSYKLGYVEEKFSTYYGQYDFIKYAARENGLDILEVCEKLGFDSCIGYGEFAILSPQQILSYQETDHEWSPEELGENNSAAESLSAFETKSNDYIRAARAGRPYKTMPGNRFLRRLKIKMNGGNNVWFDIDINRLFKQGSFAVKIPVIGETSEYTCVVSFDEWLPKLKEDIAKTGFTQLTIKRSLMEMLRFHDLKLRCSCPDFRYRHSYWLTVHQEIEGDPELRPSGKTNPKDDLGKICKHLNFCLNNKIYGDKESRIIYNYLVNLKRTRRMMFDKIVAPKLGLDQIDESLGGTKKPEPQPEPKAQEQPVQQEPQENTQDQTNDETLDDGGNQE